MANFIFTETKIKDLYLIEPKLHGDRRGYFMETYNENEFKAAGLNYNFVQENQSSSVKGVLRGLHFQKEHPQAKLVRAIMGEVYDVAVDLRGDSETYGQWVGAVLSAENRLEMMIPRGFAHGFVVLSDRAAFSYQCDDFYHPEDEGGIIYNDSILNIDWPNPGERILSDKDQILPALKDSEIKF